MTENGVANVWLRDTEPSADGKCACGCGDHNCGCQEKDCGGNCCSDKGCGEDHHFILLDKTPATCLTLGYDRESLKDPTVCYTGPRMTDRYGRQVPQSAHGTVTLPEKTASAKIITQAYTGLFDQIADKRLLQRRLTLGADLYGREAAQEEEPQLTLFAAPEEDRRQELAREQAKLEAMLKIKERFGKNAIFRGMNLEEGATARERNGRIGGHQE